MSTTLTPFRRHGIMDSGGEIMENETRLTLRIPEKLKKLLLEESEKQNRSLNNLIITILLNYFANR